MYRDEMRAHWPDMTTFGRRVLEILLRPLPPPPDRFATHQERANTYLMQRCQSCLSHTNRIPPPELKGVAPRKRTFDSPFGVCPRRRSKRFFVSRHGAESSVCPGVPGALLLVFLPNLPLAEIKKTEADSNASRQPRVTPKITSTYLT